MKITLSIKNISLVFIGFSFALFLFYSPTHSPIQVKHVHGLLGGGSICCPTDATEATQQRNLGELQQIRAVLQNQIQPDTRRIMDDTILIEEWTGDLRTYWYDLTPTQWARNQQLARDVTAEMVNHINTGMGGDPAFVQSLGRYEEAVTDYTGTEFIQTLDYTMDTPFNRDLQIALSRVHDRTMTDQELGFTAGDTGAHQQFLDGDFSAGGWDRFYDTISNPEGNTPFGAWGVAQERYRIAIETARERELRRLDWGQGFRSMEECRFDGSQTICQVTTPGQIITGQLDRALGIGLESLVQADKYQQGFTPGTNLLNEDFVTPLVRLGERAIDPAQDGTIAIAGGTVFGGGGDLDPGDITTVEPADPATGYSDTSWCAYITQESGTDLCADAIQSIEDIDPFLLNFIVVEDLVDDFMRNTLNLGDPFEDPIDVVAIDAIAQYIESLLP